MQPKLSVLGSSAEQGLLAGSFTGAGWQRQVFLQPAAEAATSQLDHYVGLQSAAIQGVLGQHRRSRFWVAASTSSAVLFLSASTASGTQAGSWLCVSKAAAEVLLYRELLLLHLLLLGCDASLGSAS